MEKKKFVFQLDTPYSAVLWPQVTSEDQDTILELLCSLLSPLGQYRSRHIQPSKGKRASKRKRREAGVAEAEPTSPPAPEISTYVDVGLAAITRHLHSMAAGGDKSAPVAASDLEPSAQKTSGLYYTAIFLARAGQSSTLTNHLPQMVAVASETHPSRPPTRLVGLSKACQDRLSECIGIPCASCIGLREDAPNSKALIDFIREHVPVIDVPWLKEAQKTAHLETKIETIQTFVGQRRQGRQSR
ncbi:uncharacterized protein BCR38DRAFT_445632 [Pseudomassariella vexata]|uniref:Uncharacterized protein n=1 Tax=Pseudomassariella vexata TaxID=1141098 RepID=A0A1Y2DIP7_9PEZI|nr:uncharacterized protein BCR38DRAFT_445632 [Pseudomassariella vexata]ORY59103.1 hypothetical protein BCR38DRAFT_445632 [Pseudomassariella vexata]